MIDHAAFIAEVKKRTDAGDTLADAVSRVWHANRLTNALRDEAIQRGLADIAAEELLTAPRNQIMRSAAVRRTASQTVTHVVTVVRSSLRDWPIATVAGVRRLEDCSVEEVEAEVAHMQRTIDGLERRRDVIARVAKATRDAGLTRVGDLPDAVLDECLDE